MTIIENLEKNIKNLEKYVDVKKDKLSEVFKFFYDDMLALDMSFFAKTEQVRIFEKAFGRDIVYITYVSIFNRLSKEKNIYKIAHKNIKLENENEVNLVATFPAKNRMKSEDKQAVSNDSKNESKEEIRVRRNKALMNLENNDEIASEFDEFK
jgi:hypothetical protein